MNTVSSLAPFAEIVRDHTARSHDLDWSTPNWAQCVYCQGAAVDMRPLGLPWVEFKFASLELACEGPTMYGEDGARLQGPRGTGARSRTFPDAESTRCQWFLLCDQTATGTTPHPVMGPVPTCDRCHRFAIGER